MNTSPHCQQNLILHHPTFILIANKKRRLSWFLSSLMFFLYVFYILVIGMRPDLFDTPIYAGMTTTWGVIIGLFIILFAISITGLYVYKANGEFERLNCQLLEDIGHA